MFIYNILSKTSYDICPECHSIETTKVILNNKPKNICKSCEHIW